LTVGDGDLSVGRLLADLRWSRKKAKKEAQRRNEQLQAHWRVKRLDWQPWQLVFVDESAYAPRTGDRKYGHSNQNLTKMLFSGSASFSKSWSY
jgi:hypothetical protein